MWLVYCDSWNAISASIVEVVLNVESRLDWIEMRLRGGIVTAAPGVDVHEVWADPIVHENAVLTPFMRSVKLSAELGLTSAVVVTARLLAVTVAFGESI